MNRFALVAAGGAICALLAAGFGHIAGAQNAPVADPAVRPALLIAAPDRAVLLGIAHAERRLVAVGERGIIVVSDDDGRKWRQVAVPTSVTLTAVAFANARDGWAVGHAGTVLHTLDGGEHWSRQFDGVTAAALTSRDAASARTTSGAALRKLAGELVADGADAPFLALAVFDARRVMIAGANGLLFATTDGGSTWSSLFSRTDNVTGRNYYAIAAHGAEIFVVGEGGLVEHSRDDARTFARIATPYGGTFFSASVPRPGTLFLAGLRGHALWSSDDGAHFRPVRSAALVSFSSIAPTRAGGAVLTNQAGQILTSTPAGNPIVPAASPPLFPLSAAIEAGDNALVAVGAGGAVRLPPPLPMKGTP